MNGALLMRQQIPPVTARTAEGRIVRAWDYKQKRNLVIAFLHADCARCEGWLAQLAAQAADLSKREAAVLARVDVFVADRYGELYAQNGSRRMPPDSQPPLKS